MCSQNSANRESVLERFQRSMVIDQEKWRDGIGYDIDALKEASESDLRTIEKILTEHQPRDWRDIEALAFINTPTARKVLSDAIKDDCSKVRMAVVRYMPDLVADKKRAASLVRALKKVQAFDDLSTILDEVENFHPPEIIKALLQGTLKKDGEIAVHFAALLFFLHAKAESPFDMNHRPFFLRFNTENTVERKQAFRELCQIIEVNPSNVK